MTTSLKNKLSPSLISDLQEALVSRKESCSDTQSETAKSQPSFSEGESTEISPNVSNTKPVVLVTNGDGIKSPGLVFLVEALVREGQCSVHICAPETDKSVSGHSMTIGDALAVSSTEIKGAEGFEVAGTPADCVSLALSGALFSCSQPALVISGINKGSNCGHHIFYSGGVAGAREALICGVPSLSIFLNWKKDESCDNDFKDAVALCLPLIHAALRDIEKGYFWKYCALNIEFPVSPSANKGFKITKRSLWRCSPNWQEMSGSKCMPAGNFMSKQQSLGIQLAQLSRDASAAGAARRMNLQRKTVEIDSVAEAGKPEPRGATKKYFSLEFLDDKQAEIDEDLDFKAVELGFVAVTPFCLSSHMEGEAATSVAQWLAATVATKL